MYRKVIDPRRHLPGPCSISRRAIPLTWNGCFDQGKHGPVTSSGYGDGIVGAAAEKLASSWKIELRDGSSMMREVSKLFVGWVLEDVCTGEGREGRCYWCGKV